MSDDTTETTETTETEKPKTNDAEFYKAEARKAFEARDRVKEELRRLQDSGLSSEQAEEYKALKAAQEEAEHRKLQERGEFEKSLEKINQRHADALKEREEKAAAAEAKLRDTLVGLEFAQAADWFGDNGKTVLAPEVAEAYFGRYVTVTDDGVVVNGTDGSPIIDISTGRPAAFSDAIGELIDSLPNKNRILRGSGKTGSGSSGGADDAVLTTASRADLAQRAMKGDPEAIKALRQTRSTGPSKSIWDRAG